MATGGFENLYKPMNKSQLKVKKNTEFLSASTN